ncbi:related to endoglucanase IV precursor [Fusarium torulosum]|uniref:lytic cellulose monooxygenase (C4-dehydrogenating) n=1 Tax=Fusarium torulosum TaxID=33205 RepID=A0AAE8MHY7_9HYPO|nr:related to endoglucanase IV precursor [Fusarium torulosum]
MPSFTTKTFLAALAGAVSVAAHGHVESISVGGTKYEGLNPGSAPYDNPRKELVAWFATNTDNGFVAPSAFGDADIICHKGAENAVKSAKVKAGEKITINLKAGSYVLRHEIIALHAAGQENGAQNYPQCFNLEVTGSGTEQPAGVAGTSLYTATEKAGHR